MAKGGNTAQTVPPAIETMQQDECLRLSIQGFTQGQIAKQLGVSQPTVHRRIVAGCKQIKSPAVAEYREHENARLDEMYAIAARIAHDPNKDDEIRLKALDGMNRTSERRAKLMGLDAPVKVDITTTEVTEQELELQEMLREAEAAKGSRGSRPQGHPAEVGVTPVGRSPGASREPACRCGRAARDGAAA